MIVFKKVFILTPGFCILRLLLRFKPDKEIGPFDFNRGRDLKVAKGVSQPEVAPTSLYWTIFRIDKYTDA